MEKKKWLIVNYNLPSKPSRHRVAVWRKLKKMGAINVMRAMWILPYSEAHNAALQQICHEIMACGGEPLLMMSVFYDEQQEEKIISLFNIERDQEYQRLIQECESFFQELSSESSPESLAKLTAKENKLLKLTKWYRNIAARDLFASSLGGKARALIEKIEQVLADHRVWIYQNQNNV